MSIISALQRLYRVKMLSIGFVIPFIIGIYLLVVSLCHKWATKLTERCSVLISSQHFNEASKLAREAIRLYPDYAPAHHELGIALSREGKYSDAIVEFKLAIRLSSIYPFPSTYFEMGNAYNNTGKKALARAAWMEVLKLDNGQWATMARKQLNKYPE